MNNLLMSDYERREINGLAMSKMCLKDRTKDDFWAADRYNEVMRQFVKLKSKFSIPDWLGFPIAKETMDQYNKNVTCQIKTCS